MRHPPAKKKHRPEGTYAAAVIRLSPEDIPAPSPEILRVGALRQARKRNRPVTLPRVVYSEWDDVWAWEDPLLVEMEGCP